MAYVPPPPGSTVPGLPTPDEVRKQDVHITDLPPEVRKSFLMSMVFFPSMIGAAICLLMFLAWLLIFHAKEAPQYAKELGSPDMRRRWTAAREMAEHIKRYDDKDYSRIYAPETLTALIEILDNPELDKEVGEWTPSNWLRQENEKGSLRVWAARMTGHVGALLKNPADHERALQALLKALDEPSIAINAAMGLAFMRDPKAADALTRKLESDTDEGLRCAAAEALGAIGEYLMAEPNAGDAEMLRNALRQAYRAENSRAKPDAFVMDNLAIALARMKDSEGLPRLKELEKDGDPSVRDNARRAVEVLQPPAEKK